jgi:hypothetical protein
MARPKKDQADKLTRAVSFRLSDADHAAYLAKVEASGMSPAAFFRECVMTNKTQVIAQPKTSQDKARLLYLFNKASNNMNQLARAANAANLAGKVGDRTYEQLLTELQELGHLMKASLRHVD